jgi:hypothetical protein
MTVHGLRVLEELSMYCWFAAVRASSLASPVPLEGASQRSASLRRGRSAADAVDRKRMAPGAGTFGSKRVLGL